MHHPIIKGGGETPSQKSLLFTQITYKVIIAGGAAHFWSSRPFFIPLAPRRRELERGIISIATKNLVGGIHMICVR
jgi:hypothetical protein